MSIGTANQGRVPRVTIAIPTFNRVQLLQRAINSALRQSYSDVEVLVSDNASADASVKQFLFDIPTCYPGVQVFVQEENHGPIENFLYLLEMASGKYFMWLADDDEISENYVATLAQVLEENSDVVTAMGQWVLVRADGSHTDMEMDTSIFSDKSTWRRILKYCWKSKDAFYYGLHRTEALRKATYSRFWWPNQNVVMNSAYIFLFDLVAQGRIVLTPDKSARWLNHHYSDKLYHRELGGGVGVLAFAIRRVNIYSCYFLKALKWGMFASAATLIVVGPLAWIRDVRRPFGRLLAAILRKTIRLGR